MFDFDRRQRWTFGAVGIAAVAAILGLEIATEENGVSASELVLEVLELALTIAAAGALTLLFARVREQHQERMALARDLEAARREGADLRAKIRAHVDGLGDAIETQFERWELTDAESAVALLMLKGFSHKEIAALRGTSEATVRQQATSAYRRSGLNGRAAFCAFFLEDLLAPSREWSASSPRLS